MKSIKMNNYSKNEKSKYLGMHDEEDVAENQELKPSLKRISEIEKSHLNLEKIVNQRTKELVEVIATNHRFVSIIAHDLRSPFSSIIGILGLLKKSIEDFNPGEIESLIDKAIDSSTRTLILLDELLIWYTAQNSIKTIKPVKIDLTGMVENEFQDFAYLANQKELVLNRNIPSNHYVSADPMMMKTILRNLISNAIKFSNKGGTINISSTEKESFIEISVKDTGVGISDDMQRKLFKIDPFQTSPGTGNEKGTGMGLIICKEFVTLHGGDIYVKSDPGKGSEFIFTLPHYI